MVCLVTYAEILGAPNAAELLAEYEAECALPELGATNPQRKSYAAMEATGAFQCFGVYEGDALVGFASVLVYLNPHYNRRIATVESLFVSQAHRTGSAWLGLKTALKEHARKQGCAALLMSAPVGSRLAKVLFLEECRHSNHVFVWSL